jgi:RNA polymerase sigma-70 factor (ECF subfamily)
MAASEDDEERAMVERIRAGDRGPFADLVKKHRDGLRRMLRGYVRTDEEAEDLTQQTFMHALRGIGAFRFDAALSTWFYSIGKNLARNHARDLRRAPSISIEDVEIITNALGTGRLAAREARRKLGAAVEQLPAKQRMVVELRLVHEMSFRAIAGIANCSEESARSNYQHAVKKLRELTMGVKGA